MLIGGPFLDSTSCHC